MAEGCLFVGFKSNFSRFYWGAVLFNELARHSTLRR
jgi:hypothetical protein